MSKQYLGKVYTKEWANKLSAKEVDRLFSNYDAKLLGQMVESSGKLIIRIYQMGACATLGISNHDALGEWLTTPSKYAGLRAAIAAELMIGFWLGNGVILAVEVVDSLNYCIKTLTGSSIE